MVLEEEEKRRLEQLPKKVRVQELKRILHNREQIAEDKGWHVFEPITNESMTLKCTVCQQMVDCAVASKQNGSTYQSFSWRKAQKLCGGEAMAGRDRLFDKQGKQKNEVRYLRVQNGCMTVHNEEVWGKEPRKHVWSLCTLVNRGEMHCRRRGCQLNEEPTTFTGKFQYFKTRPCRGDELAEERHGGAYDHATR